VDALDDDSGFVRATAAASLGFAGRRLAASGGHRAAAQAVEALAEAMDREDYANDHFGAGEGPSDGDPRSWSTQTRPNSVRSAVRENAAISLAMLATVMDGAGDVWGAAAPMLERVLLEDTNKFVVSHNCSQAIRHCL